MTLSLFSLDHGRSLDAGARCRNQFAIPGQASGEDQYYFLGNSLGLQPEAARKAVI